MQLKGKVWKESRFWLIECPAIGAMTQGTTRADALAMMVDWIRTTVDDVDFAVEIEASKEGETTMRFENPKPIVALMLSQARTAAGLTLKDVAQRLGAKTRSAVSTYESGKHDPGFVKVQELLRAMGLDLEVRLVPCAPARPAKKKAG